MSRVLQHVFFVCSYLLLKAVESDAANEMMDLIRSKYVNGDVSSIPPNPAGFTLVDGVEFA